MFVGLKASHDTTRDSQFEAVASGAASPRRQRRNDKPGVVGDDRTPLCQRLHVRRKVACPQHGAARVLPANANELFFADELAIPIGEKPNPYAVDLQSIC